MVKILRACDSPKVRFCVTKPDLLDFVSISLNAPSARSTGVGTGDAAMFPRYGTSVSSFGHGSPNMQIEPKEERVGTAVITPAIIQPRGELSIPEGVALSVVVCGTEFWNSPRAFFQLFLRLLIDPTRRINSRKGFLQRTAFAIARQSDTLRLALLAQRS